jgi:hypothetical protein
MAIKNVSRAPIDGEKGHIWIKEDSGIVDIWAYEPSEYCYGPVCKICGYGYCIGCYDEPQEECVED